LRASRSLAVEATVERPDLPEPNESAAPPSKRLSPRVRELLRLRHYSFRTEKSYSDWMSRFVRFHGGRHPEEMGSAEVLSFPTYLAVERHVSPSTQKQAQSALLFLLPQRPRARALRPRTRGARAAGAGGPVVMSVDEVCAVLGRLRGEHRLVATLLYGSGLRLLECLCLRVKDLDFERHPLCVRHGKGRKDRYAPLARALREPIAEHLKGVRRLYESDRTAGQGCAPLPYALDRKLGPEAATAWAWQWVFPARQRSVDARTEPWFGTTSTPARSSVRSAPPPGRPASRNASPPTPSGTLSRRTCSRAAPTSATSRSCSATAI
jgi:integrase